MSNDIEITPEFMRRALDQAIAEKEARAEQLRALTTELSKTVTDLDALKRARQVYDGDTPPPIEATSTKQPRFAFPKTATIADKIEHVLKGVPEMHADEILTRLHALGVKTTKANVVNTILRDVRKGRRFKKTKPNTFALLR